MNFVLFTMILELIEKRDTRTENDYFTKLFNCGDDVKQIRKAAHVLGV